MMAIHGAAGLVILMLALAIVWRLTILCMIGVSFSWICWSSIWRRAPWSIQAAHWGTTATWTLTLANGSQHQAQLLPTETLVTQWLIILRFKIGKWKKRTLLLTTDSVDQAMLHLLRVRLRIDTNIR
jgi:hypothetical protein